MQISPACKRPLSPSLQIGIPVGLAALGAWGALDNGWYHQQRESIRTQFLQWRKDKFIHVDDYIQYLATPTFLTLGFVPGIQARHNFRDRLLLGATSYALMGAMVNATKYTVKSLRPDASARNSFPSGHTATAVMGAELVRSEYGNWAGLGAYAVAATVGVLRMYNNRHWINDVLGGAACGFASVRLGLLLLPLEKKLFGWDRQKALEKKTDKGTYSSLLVLPNFDVSQSTVGFAALWTF
ncbi:MAG: phosphatase PAP2 family protein [Alloprevotella sp.]|nr:phosphatase PAP2 family protein [Alloprevotella sp.]